MGKIILNGMIFREYHGCYDFEKTEGNDFRVDLTLDYNSARAEKSDRLGDSLDYEKIVGIISKEMEKPSNLLENLARRILDSIREKAAGIEKVKIRVCKINPPTRVKLEEFCFELEESNE